VGEREEEGSPMEVDQLCHQVYEARGHKVEADTEARSAMRPRPNATRPRPEWTNNQCAC